MTLKREPVIKKDDKPKVSYNRLTGAFEVFRPVVEDKDAGAVRYTYIPYRLEGSDKIAETPQTISATASEPVQFWLTSGETYVFGVEMEFFDNEKTVYYDLGQSESIEATGDTMPKITLEPTGDSGVEFNKYDGTLRISLGKNSNIQVDGNHPLTLEFFADQVMTGTKVVLTTVDEPVNVNGSDDTLGTVTLKSILTGTGGNEIDVTLNLKELYKNTNYTISVSGYLNVGDNNTGVNRAVGNVSFRTYDTVDLAAKWSTPSSSNYTINRTLSIDVQDNEASDTRKAYALDELVQGQVTLTLYSGIGAQRVQIGQRNINDEQDLEKLYSKEGLDINEATFAVSGSSLTQTAGFTIVISQVADKTYEIADLGYVNDFEDVLGATETVTAQPTPPDLLTDASKGVTAVPILNDEAAQYGGTLNKKLPDDAIVGYALTANYLNDQRLGKNITYYAFEYNSFYNAIIPMSSAEQADPIQNDSVTKVAKVTTPIDSTSDTVPKVALFFGGNADKEGSMYNGWLVKYAGEANKTGGSLASGMGRGYRYIFAYTVEYSSGGEEGESATKTYPYDHKDYGNWELYPGGITENGETVGDGVAYILNSGMCEAPVVMPDFHTYVYESTASQVNGMSTSSEGEVTIHYTWRDPEGKAEQNNAVIKDDTQLTYIDPRNNEEVAKQLDEKTVAEADDWYEVKIPYFAPKSNSTILEPKVKIKEYHLDYTTVLNKFKLEKDSDTYTLCTVPVDFSYGELFENSSYQESVRLNMVPNYGENYIRFYLQDTGGSDAVKDLAKRAVALRLTFKADGIDSKTLTVPLVDDGINNVYGLVTTGALGNDFVGKTFEVVDAKLLFDNGMQGWSLVEKDGEKGVLLQYINSGTGTDFGLSNYVGASVSGDITANQALLKVTGVTPEGIRNTINPADFELDSKMKLNYQGLMNTGSNVLYLYPDRMGVDASSMSSVTSLSGKYLTPKQVAEYDLKFVSGLNTGKIENITPSMDYTTLQTSQSTVGVSGLKVSGLGTGGGTIYMGAFASKIDAEKFILVAPGAFQTITIGKDGGPVAGEDLEIKDLKEQTEYYIGFYYVNNAGDKVMLLDAKTAHKAIYKVTTSDEAKITVNDVVYENTSYFDKNVTIEYNINRVFNLEMRYDIFDNATATGDPLLSQEEMITNGSDQILDSGTLSYVNNKIKLWLTPQAARKKLVPGHTYYMRIQAVNENSGVAEGTEIVPFTITEVGNYGALIYVGNATQDSLDFQVTINDAQYSFMGRDNEKDGRYGLYAVRFTDKNGNLINTEYDDKVYDSNVLRKDFVLNDTVIKNNGVNNVTMTAGQEYQMRIYAIPDVEHDGVVEVNKDNKDWTDFFDKNGSLADCGVKFNKIIDSIWNNNDAIENLELEKQFLVATKSQATLTDAGYYLNTEKVITDRQDAKTLRIIFQDSYGLIQTGDERVFKKIDWQVDGFTAADGAPVSLSGEIKGETMHGGFYGKYPVYYLDIPADVVKGSYTIILHLHTKADGSDEPEKIILNIAG